jgi:uncharacterized protein
MVPTKLLTGTIAAGLIAVVLYVGLSPGIAWPLYERLLFQPGHNLGSEEPWKLIERDFKVSRKDVTFSTSDGKLIHGWFIKLPNTDRVFLVSQGKGGSLYNRSGMARMLLRCGGSVLLYNYRGYGQSEGTPSLDGVCLDAIGAYDYLVQKERASQEKIIAYGESFGTGVTGQLVSHRKVGAVIMQSGFTSLLRAGRDTLPWLRLYPDSWFPPQILDNLAVFIKQHPPLLIVHGRKDRMVLYQNAVDLFDAAAEPKRFLVLPEGDHGSFGKGNEYFDTVADFLKKNNL